MNGSINYLVTTNVTCKPIIIGTSELESLHNYLMALSAEQNGGLEILDTQRCVIDASGKVFYIQVAITFDRNGLEIRDRYGCLIDSYSVPEPGKRRFKVICYETWANSTVVDADSAAEAKKAVDQMVQDGEFDVLDGWYEDVWYEVIEEGETK